MRFNTFLATAMVVSVTTLALSTAAKEPIDPIAPARGVDLAQLATGPH